MTTVDSTSKHPDTAGAFRKLLMTLSPDHFERVLVDWAKYCLGASTEDSLEAVAIDGKTLCGTLQPHGEDKGVRTVLPKSF